MTAWRANPAPFVLVGAGAASAALLLVLGADVAFMFEDWELLLNRRGFTPDAFLDPLNEHLSLLPVAIYKALQAAFGMDSSFPFHLVATLLLLSSGAVVFVYLRRCVGDWLAVLGTILVLFLGSAWEILLWPLTLSFSGSTAAGVGMLLALQREDRRGDVLACVLLATSIAFLSLGLIFAAAAATAVFLRGERRLARGYVVAVPALLYGLWYFGWGRDVESGLSLDNALAAPRFVLEGVASSIGAVLGLFALQPYVGNVARIAGAVLVGLGAVAVVLWLARNGRLDWRTRYRSPWFWSAAVLFLGFWVAGALNDVPWRTPSASRYMYSGAVLLLLLLAETFRGSRIGGRQGLVVSALAALALGGNLVALRDGHRVLEREGQLINAELGALEIARDRVRPAFQPAFVPSGSPALANLDAGRYLSAVDSFGSLADEPPDLGGRPESVRAAADVVLAHALRLSLEPAPGADPAGRPGPQQGPADRERTGCAVSGGVDHTPASAARVPTGRVALRATATAPVRLRRFAAESFPVELGELDPGEWAILELPSDGAREPWELEIAASRAITICKA